MARPWYKRNPKDALTGMMKLTLEEKGAYNVVIDLIYLHGGPVDDDEGYIARFCGCSVRKWRALRDQLLAAGRLYRTPDGRISDERAEAELAPNQAEGEAFAESAAKSHRKRAENAAKTPQEIPENGHDLADINDLKENRLLHRGRVSESRYQNITAAEDASGREEISGPDRGGGPSVALSAEEPSPADALIQAFDAAILTAWGPDTVRVVVPGDDRTASRWVDAGVTPEQVRRVAGRVFDRMRRAGRTPPKALGYLTDSLTEDMTSAATPLLVPKPAQMAGAVTGSDPEDAKWQARMSGWRRNKFWSDDLFGPAPGEPGCRVPAKYLNAEMVQ
ncbi:YdaU family protein [Niveispirillum cyanobacteriorum]|uniref:Uncharacterized protein n=1 Tax=Niveispirillum cyanobacteriorum TaxID=1612173 RepID=A0A2K9NFQ9_9PROT|nr:YdaU family protein [Niveispirillum cyanobacteriorum]AUN31964.1 hypothetical protein C0V82_16170 [Niveispirillum cyanobacteriorum]GGE85393.1 hypothetical protein GCM10011317_48210 [Niveispirillum cyanobacteriorum]